MKDAYKITISIVGLQRILRAMCRLVDAGGEINKAEQNSINYMLHQCTYEEQDILIERYGEVLTFLKKKERI